MFDLNKLAEVTNVAKKVQARQEELQLKQIKLMEKVSGQLDEVINILKNKD
ncbi:MAG: hypothetical protein GY858_05370 [Candidatus Omnitrophica bacterium]|nr:hypothetical protein [Candidatus Omnitrophota bacterium]